MHARSALFDVYGDHLHRRDNRAPVAALVRMLSPLGITAAAVRTAISRMVRQGWLEPVSLRAGRGYAATGKAVRRLDDAAARIYRTGDVAWDGRWHLLVLEPVLDRAARERVRSGLRFLGYAPLSDSTWLSPHTSEEVDSLLAAEGARATRFLASDAEPAQPTQPAQPAQPARPAQPGQPARPGRPGQDLVAAWDLDALAAAYTTWHRTAEQMLSAPTRGYDSTEEASFALRSQLVHEWRKFLFLDPGLPSPLLPDDWPGHRAAAFFDEQAARLLPPAARFVDACLSEAR